MSYRPGGKRRLLPVRQRGRGLSRRAAPVQEAMAYKNALAGLDHGGGEAVIIGDPARLKQMAAEALDGLLGRG